MDVHIDMLISHIRLVTQDIMEKEISTMTKEVQKSKKQSEVYDAYTPTQYDRTYEFLNSNDTKLDKKVYKNNIYMFVYTPTTLEFMGRHPSWVDGSNQNKNIPYWIQNGNDSPLFSYEARDYITPTRNEIDMKLKATLIKGYRRYGIVAT